MLLWVEQQNVDVIDPAPLSREHLSLSFSPFQATYQVVTHCIDSRVLFWVHSLFFNVLSTCERVAFAIEVNNSRAHIGGTLEPLTSTKNKISLSALFLTIYDGNDILLYV